MDKSKLLRLKKLIFHATGLSSVFTSSVLMLWVFLNILVRDVFVAMEPNPIIVLLEIGVSVFAVFYVFHVGVVQIG